jgi:putative ABC transport system substrate-binding protein
LLPGPTGASNGELIVALAARHRLPAVYAFRYHVVSGGLASYGSTTSTSTGARRGTSTASFKGEKAAELPVEHASKFQLVINLKTANWSRTAAGSARHRPR